MVQNDLIAKTETANEICTKEGIMSTESKFLNSYNYH